jgi:hypothetical protein
MTQVVQPGHLHQGLGVMARNQSAYLGRALPSEDALLLAQIRAGIAPDRKREALDRLREIRAEFLARHPEAARSRDFRRVVGRQGASVVVAHGFRPFGLIPLAALRMGPRYPVLPTVVRRAYWALRRAWSSQSKTSGNRR